MLDDLHKGANYLDRAAHAFRGADAIFLKKIVNDSIRDASLASDKRLAEIAVIAYALMKISSKEHIANSSNWGHARKKILEHLEDAKFSLLKGDEKKFESDLNRIRESVSSVDYELGHYITDSINKARLKMASSAYAFGLSLGSAADLTGADSKELMQYIGATKIHDEEEIELNITQRIRKFTSLLRS